MASIKQSRSISFLIIALVYVIATVIGVYVFNYLEGKPGFTDFGDIERLFWADFWATVFVWFLGVLFANTSVYDPYWSVAPPLMLTGYAMYCDSWGIPVILLLIGIWVWGIRLTGNWAWMFTNLTIQDWRYDKYKTEFPYLWHIINFFGLNLMPTLVVFLGMIPGFVLIQLNITDANVGTYAACLLCLVAAGLELVADNTSHRFRREHKGQVCDVGVWKYTRHPNYLGEISMWWGVYFILLSVAPEEWKTIAGAIATTLLFVCITIPLMEERQLTNKPGYAAYKKNTSMLLPWFSRA